MRPGRAAAGAALAALLAGLGCRENVTSPGSCPDLCPAASVVLVDTVLTGIVASDSSYRGYFAPAEAQILALADLDSLRSVALVRFGARDSTWYPSTNDTAVKIATVDSVQLRITLASRDTTAKNLRILVYRIPAAFDTGMTWADVQPYLADSELVDTIAVADTVTSGDVLWTLPHGVVDTITGADAGVVAFAFAVRASSKTGLGLTSTEDASGGPHLEWFVHAGAPRDTLTHAFLVGTDYDTFVYDPPPTMPASALVAGGLPSARSIIRLQLPREAIDSVRVVRATLILTPMQRARGLPKESFLLSARGIVRDLGPKSVIFADTSAGGTASVAVGDSNEVHIEVGRLLRAWGTTAGDSLPRVIMLLGEPEGGGMTEVTLGRGNAGAAAPRLRLTFVRPYPFGLP
ncbi:MAG: hypothetical protein ABSB58_04200 [Gemmatimonadales bacterium]